LSFFNWVFSKKYPFCCPFWPKIQKLSYKWPFWVKNRQTFFFENFTKMLKTLYPSIFDQRIYWVTNWAFFWTNTPFLHYFFQFFLLQNLVTFWSHFPNRDNSQICLKRWINMIKKLAIYVPYPLYSWKHNFDQKIAICVSPPAILCYVRGTSFFFFFFSSRFIKKWQFICITCNCCPFRPFFVSQKKIDNFGLKTKENSPKSR
jgi:hypothetical protein